MKIFKYLLVVISLLFCSSDLISAKRGWNRVYIPSNYSINKIVFNDQNYGVIITVGKELFVTKDGGQTYEELSKNKFIEDSIFYDITMFRDTEIYLSTDKNIYLSTDSCVTWNKINNLDSIGNKLVCRELFKFENYCYCQTFNDIYSSTSNMQKWDSVAQHYNGFTQINSFCSFNDSIFILGENHYFVNTGSRWYNAKVFKNNEELKGVKQLSSIFYSSYILNDLKIFDNDIYLSTTNGIGKSVNLCFNIDTFYIGQGFKISKINNNLFYFYASNILQYDNLKQKYITQYDGIKPIDNVIVINDSVAFAYFSDFSNDFDIINYFLKTEDGGGVDLSDVEEVIPQNEITQSTHIELYNILGRSIVTFPSYEKLKAEIENYPPPHLIKWRDEKGISHFEKMK